eukprot:1358388-Pyramimonas_sp.AAC.1
MGTLACDPVEPLRLHFTSVDALYVGIKSKNDYLAQRIAECEPVFGHRSSSRPISGVPML